MKGLRDPELAIGVGSALVGAGLAVGATQISSEAGYSGVGPNFLPWVVGAMLALCGVLLVREALTGGYREREEPSGAATGHWAGFAWVSVGVLVNAALITTIGFILSCSLCFVLAVRGFKSAEGRLDLSLRALARRCRRRLRDRRAGVLDVHAAAGDQPARPHGHRLAVKRRGAFCSGA